MNNKPLASVAERIADLLKLNGPLLRKRKLKAREEDEKDSPIFSTPSKRLKERMKPKRTKSISATESMLTSPASTTTSNESEEDRRCVEEVLSSSPPSYPAWDVDHCLASTTWSKTVYGRVDPGEYHTTNVGGCHVP